MFAVQHPHRQNHLDRHLDTTNYQDHCLSPHHNRCLFHRIPLLLQGKLHHHHHCNHYHFGPYHLVLHRLLQRPLNRQNHLRRHHDETLSIQIRRFPRHNYCPDHHKSQPPQD